MAVRIPLSQGLEAIVDDADAGLVGGFRWQAGCHRGRWYARRGVWVEGKNSAVFMHTFLMGFLFVDHINGDGLDNRRENLRSATRSQNMQNKRRKRSAASAFKGLYWCARDSSWRARITVDGQRMHLGRFADQRAAALAYDEAARVHFGEFAALNFPNADERSALTSARRPRP